jgi:hypothetical protein
MAAVEFPVEALGTAVSDGAWFWAPGRSRFPCGLPPASGLELASLRTAPRRRCPKIGGVQSAMARDFGERIALASGSWRSASRLKTARALPSGGNLRRSGVWRAMPRPA